MDELTKRFPKVMPSRPDKALNSDFVNWTNRVPYRSRYLHGGFHVSTNAKGSSCNHVSCLLH